MTLQHQTNVLDAVDRLRSILKQRGCPTSLRHDRVRIVMEGRMKSHHHHPGEDGASLALNVHALSPTDRDHLVKVVLDQLIRDFELTAEIRGALLHLNLSRHCVLWSALFCDLVSSDAVRIKSSLDAEETKIAVDTDWIQLQRKLQSDLVSQLTLFGAAFAYPKRSKPDDLLRSSENLTSSHTAPKHPQTTSPYHYEQAFIRYMHDVLESNPMRRLALDRFHRDHKHPPPAQVCQILARSALVCFVLSLRSVGSMQVPSLPDALPNDGMLGPPWSKGVYLQYTHARLCGIERASGIRRLSRDDDGVVADAWREHTDEYGRLDAVRGLPEQEAWSLAKHLLYYKLTLWPRLVVEPEASKLVQYLSELCRMVSSAINVLRVKQWPDPKQAMLRLCLFRQAQSILSQGLCLLGLYPLEMM